MLTCIRRVVSMTLSGQVWYQWTVYTRHSSWESVQVTISLTTIGRPSNWLTHDHPDWKPIKTLGERYSFCFLLWALLGLPCPRSGLNCLCLFLFYCYFFRWANGSVPSLSLFTPNSRKLAFSQHFCYIRVICMNVLAFFTIVIFCYKTFVWRRDLVFFSKCLAFC